MLVELKDYFKIKSDRGLDNSWPNCDFVSHSSVSSIMQQRFAGQWCKIKSSGCTDSSSQPFLRKETDCVVVNK